MNPQVTSPDADPEAQVSGPKEDTEQNVDSTKALLPQPATDENHSNHTRDGEEEREAGVPAAAAGARTHNKTEAATATAVEPQEPKVSLDEKEKSEEKSEGSPTVNAIDNGRAANGSVQSDGRDTDSEPRRSGEDHNPPDQTDSDADADASKSPKDPGSGPTKPPISAARRESFTQLLKNSWKDSLQRKDKTGKRQSSASNLSSLPPSDDTREKSGSLSKRIGKAVLSGVNKLRGKSKEKERESSDSESSDSDQEPDGEPEEEQPTSFSADDAAAKRSSTTQLPANSPVVSTPPQSPRSLSDPLTPLESILVIGPRDPSKPKNTIKFNEIVTVRRTWAKKDYDRKGEVTWKLTPERAIDIRNELNDFKKEMEIHEDSRCNTHFY